MGKIFDFREVIAWQKAHKLTIEIYQVSASFPKEELYGVISQIRRAATSVPANIAEGFARKSHAEQKHFYNIAQASLTELQYFIILSRDLSYIDSELYIKLDNQLIETSKLLYAWTHSF